MTPIKPEHAQRYPDDWQNIRSQILRRASNQCEWCGARNGEPHPRTGSQVVLTIAHVYDKRPEAADANNLAALCQRCHNRHDAHGRRHTGSTLRRDHPAPRIARLDEVLRDD